MSKPSAAPATGSSAPAPTNTSSSTNSSLEALEGFALLCKSSSGLQCVMVLKQVLKHPQIFVFGELFEIPSIKQLESSEHKPWYDLLKVFAYGTYMDYKSTKGLPDLGAVELTKLKQLTIVDMASTQRHIPYSVLQISLEIPTLRALEDLIIECINLGLIEGHLNQKDAALEISSAMGRDIGPKDVDRMIQQLGDWLNSSEAVLSTLKEQIVRVEGEEAAKRVADQELEDRKKLVTEELKANKLAASGGGGGAGADAGGKIKRQNKGIMSSILGRR